MYTHGVRCWTIWWWLYTRLGWIGGGGFAPDWAGWWTIEQQQTGGICNFFILPTPGQLQRECALCTIMRPIILCSRKWNKKKWKWENLTTSLTGSWQKSSYGTISNLTSMSGLSISCSKKRHLTDVAIKWISRCHWSKLFEIQSIQNLQLLRRYPCCLSFQFCLIFIDVVLSAIGGHGSSYLSLLQLKTSHVYSYLISALCGHLWKLKTATGDSFSSTSWLFYKYRVCVCTAMCQVNWLLVHCTCANCAQCFALLCNICAICTESVCTIMCKASPCTMYIVPVPAIMLSTLQLFFSALFVKKRCSTLIVFAIAVEQIVERQSEVSDCNSTLLIAEVAPGPGCRWCLNKNIDFWEFLKLWFFCPTCIYKQNPE